MEEKPLVSVLMTAFNRENFIAEAIESVLASTYENYELIIVDDCSSDNTVAISNSFIHDKRVKVYVNESNLGQFENRNKAASFAKGKYLKYVDSDDVLYAHSLGLMVEIMESHPDCGLGFCHYSGESKFILPHCYTSKEILLEHYFGGGILFTGPIGTIIRRDVFEEIGGFDLFGMPSDNHFSLKAASRYPVVSMYRDLFWWRVHKNQAFIGADDDINIFNNLKWNLDILSNEYCPLLEGDRLKAIKNFKRIFLKNFFVRLFKSPNRLFKFKRILTKEKIKLNVLIKEAF